MFSPKILVGVLLVTALSAGCTKQVNYQSTQYPAGNLAKDNYQPGAGWQLVWSDEFDGTTINADNWNRQVEQAGRFNGEWQRYTNSDKNAYLDQGCLVISAIHESQVHAMDQYSSARLNTANKQAWKYGKIAARIQLPYGPGIWPAFWMLGANIDEAGGDTPWPQSGEIDILELYGSRDDGVVEANIHYAGKSGAHANMGSVPFALDEGRFADNFHVFELVWGADRISWFVDGVQFATTSVADDEFAEFQQEFFILFNIAVGGRSAGRTTKNTRFPQLMYIDWVRVYQQD